MPFIENNAGWLRKVFAWATPFYKAATCVRNLLYDKGALKNYTPSLPVVCVGNLCAGGSGKTPLTEHILHVLLEPAGTVGLVTRGYGRKTKGNFLASPEHNALQIGDEPVQYMDEFGSYTKGTDPAFALYLAGNRADGIKALQAQYPGLKAVVLDDAFQHRKVDAGLNILVSDYNKPYFKDRVMPRGTLRESRKGSRRAQIIVFSKCPENLTEHRRDEFLQEARIESWQKVFFTTLEYGSPDSYNLNGPGGPFPDLNGPGGPFSNPGGPSPVFLFTGIANPQPLEEHLQQQGHEIPVHRRFGDHHNYSEKEIRVLCSLYKKLCERRPDTLLLTTRKDYCRIKNTPNFHYFCSLPLGYVPVKVKFLFQQEKEFNRLIENFVRK